MDQDLDIQNRFKNMVDNFTKKFSGMKNLSNKINEFINDVIKTISDYNNTKSFVNIRLSLEYLITKLKDHNNSNDNDKNLDNIISNLENLLPEFNDILDNQSDSYLKLLKLIDGLNSYKNNSNFIISEIKNESIKNELSNIIELKKNNINNSSIIKTSIKNSIDSNDSGLSTNTQSPQQKNLSTNQQINPFTNQQKNLSTKQQKKNIPIISQKGGKKNYFGYDIKYSNLEEILPFYKEKYFLIEDNNKPFYMILLKSFDILLNTCQKFYDTYKNHDIFKRKYYWLIIPVTILSSITGAANLALGSIASGSETVINLVIGALGIIISVISTLNNIFSFQKRKTNKNGFLFYISMT
jgi:hypothetical protein